MHAVKTLAIVGGGRWAQVTLSVIAKMQHPFKQIIIVSSMNAVEITNVVQAIEKNQPVRFAVIPTLDDLFASYQVDAAIIVNALDKHFISAQHFLKRNIPILLEKPLVTTTQEMKMLLLEASNRAINLIPGLCYRFCSYIHRFSQIVSTKKYPIKFVFEWHDSINELRYGQIKKHDHAISVLQDVLPHIWSILMQVFKTKKIDIHAAINQHDHGEIDVSIGSCNGKILLNRIATMRKRYLAVECDHEIITLNFTKEPGTITEGSNTSPADSQWENKKSPLMQQLDYFFAAVCNQTINNTDRIDSLESVIFTEHALSISAKQKGNINHACMEVDESAR